MTPRPTRTPEIRDPKTLKEWQEAADEAELLLCLDSCRQFGLIEGGPVANVERCEYILAEAHSRGVTPADAVHTLEKRIVKK